MSGEDADLLIVGRIQGVFGVRGWVKVFSYTQPRDNLLSYQGLYLRRGGQWQPVNVAEGRQHGKGIVLRIEPIADRDQAAALIGADLAIRRDQLEALEEGEYYWADLIGLRVVTVDGVELGVVDHLLETGANDVLVVKGERERLIPFVQQDVVVDVDPEHGRLVVDWDPEF